LLSFFFEVLSPLQFQLLMSHFFLFAFLAAMAAFLLFSFAAASLSYLSILAFFSAFALAAAILAASTLGPQI
jgi:hypothetical protein